MSLNEVPLPDRQSGSLSVCDVSVQVADLTILNHANLLVATGEIVALTGSSGSGKSTLLRAIAGLVKLSTGTVMWDDIALHLLPTYQRQVGMVFQDRVLFGHLDVAQNIGFGLNYTNLPKPLHAKRIDELLQLVGLSGFGKRRVDTLSGGEAQRICLARALAPSPRLLLLDEPLSALDTATRAQLTTDIRSILKAERMTAIYVTHDLVEATEVADRVVTIDRVLRQG